MKKILSTLILGSMFVPSLVFALAPPGGLPPYTPEMEERAEQGYSQEPQKRIDAKGAIRLNASTTAQGVIKDRKIEAKAEFKVNASTTRPRLASSTKEIGFCSQIDKIIVQIGNGGQTSGEKRVENIEKREEKRAEVRTEVDVRREENDTARKAQLEELTRRATTEEQKVAVLAFTEAVNKALATKKTAVDTLLAEHRKEVDQTASARKSAVEKALSTLTASIEAAKVKAKADCATGIAGDQVRTSLKESILKAQQTFRATMQSLQKETLSSSKNDKKKEELREIEATFKKSVEQAKNNLKAAFKVKVPASASTTIK